MAETILLRCDYFLGSGMGHLKRSSILAQALRERGFNPILLIDDSGEAIRSPLDVPFEKIKLQGNMFNEINDAQSIKRIAVERDIRLVIVDSYRISDTWISILSKGGLIVAVIDDLGIGKNANLSINYTPFSFLHTSIDNFNHLRGPKYFITDNLPLTKTRREPKKIVAHAGGNGDFTKTPLVYSIASEIAHELSIGMDWICPNSNSIDKLKTVIKLTKDDSILNWQSKSNELWNGYDIVLGPASTSLYEAIMQGSLPISFPLSETQSTDRKDWLSIGHALHISRDELTDSSVIKSIMNLAINKHNKLLNLLRPNAEILDGKGVYRIVEALEKLLMNPLNAVPLRSDSSRETGIRVCDISDAAYFLKARNSSKVREMSTNPSHIISWTEHLAWWLDDPAEKYTFIGDEGPEAFFWVKEWIIDGSGYLTAGWFPSGENTPFTSILRILDWQIKYYSKKFSGYIWVATVRKTNQGAIALNRRFGFVEPEPKTLKLLPQLFPGTSDQFKVLERKCI